MEKEISHPKNNWRGRISLVILSLLNGQSRLFNFIGTNTEDLLNLIYANGGFWVFIYKFIFKKGLLQPQKDSSNYLSILGYIDPRTDLYVNRFHGRQKFCATSNGSDSYNQFTADICMLASKLAYENRAVIEKIVFEEWKMNFIEYSSCSKDTQFFIFSDKKQDSEVLTVAFRGTEAFNAHDWGTDFNFDWYDLKNMGKVHVGFLEALGMDTKNQNYIEDDQEILPPAYIEITEKLKTIIKKNPNAKVYITGHSLGGALAVLYPGLLFYNNEHDLAERIAAIYTFGQPRIGDEQFASFMNKSLNKPLNRYFRIVYSCDIVPRVPFDNRDFKFKHFGLCFYFNCMYAMSVREEEPYPNSSFVGPYIAGVWEWIRSLNMEGDTGSPKFAPLQQEYWGFCFQD